MKSLRSTGMSTAARTAARSAREPPKRRCSVSTLMQWAPPASYSRASAAGSAMSASGAPARARALDLRDDADVGVAEDRSHVEGCRNAGGPRLELVQGHGGHALGDVLAHPFDDVVQHCHAAKTNCAIRTPRSQGDARPVGPSADAGSQVRHEVADDAEGEDEDQADEHRGVAPPEPGVRDLGGAPGPGTPGPPRATARPPSGTTSTMSTLWSRAPATLPVTRSWCCA